jgi:hypothetical protein
VTIGYAQQHPSDPPGDTRSPGHQVIATHLEEYRSIEELLGTESYPDALQGYRAAIAEASATGQSCLSARILSILCATDPASIHDLATAILQKHADGVTGLSALANAALARNDHEEATRYLAQVAHSASNSGDLLTAAMAQLAAARTLARSSPAESVWYFEQVLQYLPGHAEATDALVESYEASESWPELARILLRRADDTPHFDLQTEVFNIQALNRFSKYAEIPVTWYLGMTRDFSHKD